MKYKKGDVMPEDHQARRDIAVLERGLNDHLKNCAEATERNDKAHGILFKETHTVKRMTISLILLVTTVAVTAAFKVLVP
jgi:hypothetical protein